VAYAEAVGIDRTLGDRIGKKPCGVGTRTAAPAFDTHSGIHSGRKSRGTGDAGLPVGVPIA